MKSISALVRASAVCAVATGLLLSVAVSASAQLPVDSGTVFTLNCPGSPATAATDINDSGTVVGRCGSPATATWHGFIYVKGTSYADGSFEVFDYPGAQSTEAWGINNQGDVVGFYNLAGDPFYHGFVRHASNGQYETIDRAGALNTMPEDINDAGYVVGCIHNNGLMTGFVWRDGRFLALDPSNSMFTGVNESGTAIGYAMAPPDATESFIVSGVDRISVTMPATLATQAWGINQSGDVVGVYAAANRTRGFLRMHDGSLAQVSVPGSSLTRAFGINQVGTIVGVFGPGTHGFVLVK